MLKRKLGNNGPKVGAIGLGCMSFGGIFGPTDEETSLAVLDAAIAGGIDFWDTANIYGMGVSETIIGKYLTVQKADVFLATKVGIIPGTPNRFNNSADYIRSELEASLKRLNRDRIDLYYLHRRDPEVAIEAAAEVMAALIDEGLIGAYGLSEVAPGTLRRAHAVHPCFAVQNEYSLWTRLPELGLVQTCRDLGVAFIPFSPLARGMLTDTPVQPDTFGPKDWRRTNPRFVEPNYTHNVAAISAFRTFCHARGWTVPAAALAWILDQGDHLIPIPGTRSPAHLQDWLRALDIVFTDDDRAEIARLLPPGFAHGDRYNDLQMAGVERYC